MDEFLEGVGIVIGIIAGVCAITIAFIIFILGLIFFTNTGDCTVYVDNQQVYSGACKYVGVSSIGENGNTKIVSLNNGFLALFTYKRYISNNVKVN